jgi:hypothetical protein
MARARCALDAKRNAERLAEIKSAILAQKRVSARLADRIAREFLKREKELYNSGIDAAQVLNEIIDSLDSALSEKENYGIALSVLDKYSGRTDIPDIPDTQVDEAIARYRDLLFIKQEFGLKPEEEEEFLALKEFLERIGKLPVESDEGENWAEIFAARAEPVPSGVEELETFIDVPDEVRLVKFIEVSARVGKTASLLEGLGL